MDINITLLGEMITFAVFIWFTMKFVWPPITNAMEHREKKIADGLANADRAKRDLELAQHKSSEILQDAKLQASHIIDQANQRAAHIVEEAKENARKEGQIILDRANTEVEQAYNQAQQQLQNHVAELACAMTNKILEKESKGDQQNTLLNNCIEEI